MRIWPAKRWWIRLGIGLAILVAVALIANGIMAWRTERQLQARFAAIRAAGDPASILELEPEPIPDEENAAVVLERLGPRLDAFSKDYARFSDSAVGRAYDEHTDQGEAATAEQILQRRRRCRFPRLWCASPAHASDGYAPASDRDLNRNGVARSGRLGFDTESIDA